jgi:hypothetical protein
LRNILILITFVLLSCSTYNTDNKTSEMETNGSCSNYPRQLDTLRIADLYDSARWYIYTWNCDRIYLNKKDTSKTVTLGELPLTFSSSDIFSDSVEMNFKFMDENEPIIPSMTRNNLEIVSTVCFELKSRKKAYMRSRHSFSMIQKGVTSRFENPLQPDVLQYLHKKQHSLNPCFFRLAEQNGVKF